MPKKPSSSPSHVSTDKKKIAPSAGADDDILLDEDLDPEDLEDVLEEDDVSVKEEEGVIAAIEDPEKDDKEDEEEEVVDEEAILAKGDDLEILNLLAKKANRMEQGLDDDELLPDEEGMNSF